MRSELNEPQLVDAVRSSVRRQVRAALEMHGATALTECPRCGDRIISLDVPMSFAVDGAQRICRACRAQMELDAASDVFIDLGGEG